MSDDKLLLGLLRLLEQAGGDMERLAVLAEDQSLPELPLLGEDWDVIGSAKNKGRKEAQQEMLAQDFMRIEKKVEVKG